jgi:5-deoxy-glucuronate isomerase
LAVELGLRAKRDVPGYHPVVVPHGYQSYYFNVMAGPKRAWHFRNDPVHDWMFSAA